MAHPALTARRFAAVTALAALTTSPGVTGTHERRDRALGAIDPVWVRVPAGTYRVGAAGHSRNPRREVTLAAFEIADAETTNEQFARFVDATGYKTDAERRGYGLTFKEGMVDWQWASTPGAFWREPFGPGSEAPPQHPVTQISEADSEAYCAWAGLRLPTLDEWEVAARAGSDGLYPWGDELEPEGKPRANIWGGATHEHNDRRDGFVYTAPVRSYAPNAWGLYDVIGNVFEYCSDVPVDPSGERRPDLAAGRGGSWWCSAGCCNFFNLVDVGSMNRHASLANQGFRVAR